MFNPVPPYCVLWLLGWWHLNECFSNLDNLVTALAMPLSAGDMTGLNSLTATAFYMQRVKNINAMYIYICRVADECQKHETASPTQ